MAKHKSLIHATGTRLSKSSRIHGARNSADIALVIDGVVAACSDGLDAFCIMSSGDYTRQALTLRERGKRLLIVGRSSTPPSLRTACSEFINLDELSGTSPPASVWNSCPSTIAACVAGGSEFKGDSIEPNAPFAPRIIGGEQSYEVPVPAQIDAADLIPLIREQTGDHGMTTPKAIQTKCSHRYADFSPRMCGATKSRTFLQTMAVFTVDPIKDKTGRIQDYAVGFRPAALLPES